MVTERLDDARAQMRRRDHARVAEVAALAEEATTSAARGCHHLGVTVGSPADADTDQVFRSQHLIAPPSQRIWRGAHHSAAAVRRALSGRAPPHQFAAAPA